MHSPNASSQVLDTNENEGARSSDSEPKHIRTQALTSKQERKLIDYIEDKFLDITRNYKKRSHPTSTLPTLNDYLDAAHTLLTLILQIPPTAPAQAALRTAFLLRLTGEVLTSIAGYALAPTPAAQTLPRLLAFLGELDRGWCAVLRAQAWDPDAREGVDVEVQVSLSLSTPYNNTSSTSTAAARSEGLGQLDTDFSLLAPPVSQTDRTRLRSILAGGSARLEEWLEKGLHVEGTADDDLEQALERLGLQQAFDDLFYETLSEMGEFTEEMSQVDAPPLLSTC